MELEYRVIGSGEKTLLIETGIGGSFYDWYPFIERIKKDYKIVLYHRAGYGSSQISNKPRTVKHIAMELHNLIKNLGITDRFVLMGHSYGGLCAQAYAKMYSSSLKGLILLDSTSQNFNRLYNLDIPVMKSFIIVEKMVEDNLKTSNYSKKELREKYKNTIDEYKRMLSDKDSRGFEDFITNPHLFRTIAEEFKNWGNSSKELEELGVFPNIPLLVIARDKKVSVESFVKYDIPKVEAVLYEEVWRELQVELSGLSSTGRFNIANNSDHNIYIDRPDIVIDCLKTMY